MPLGELFVLSADLDYEISLLVLYFHDFGEINVRVEPSDRYNRSFNLDVKFQNLCFARKHLFSFKNWIFLKTFY